MKEILNQVGLMNEANRKAWVEKTLGKIPSGSRILDAGAGEQSYRKYCSHLVYVAQDFAKYDGSGDKVGLQTGTWDQTKLDIVSDITSIPEPDGSFDAILCVEVFEHLPEPTKALAEFARLLRPDGHLILTAPVCSLTHFAPYYFYNGFSRYFYEKFLGDFGFEITELSPNGNYFEYLGQEVRRIRWASRKYAGGKSFGIIDRLALRRCLSMLHRSSKADTGSSELLSFGLHIHARKISKSTKS